MISLCMGNAAIKINKTGKFHISKSEKDGLNDINLHHSTRKEKYDQNLEMVASVYQTDVDSEQLKVTLSANV